jgi:hypothetical protein
LEDAPADFIFLVALWQYGRLCDIRISQIGSNQVQALLDFFHQGQGGCMFFHRYNLFLSFTLVPMHLALQNYA